MHILQLLVVVHELVERASKLTCANTRPNTYVYRVDKGFYAGFYSVYEFFMKIFASYPLLVVFSCNAVSSTFPQLMLLRSFLTVDHLHG